MVSSETQRFMQLQGFTPGAKTGVALSGGADSVALAIALHRLGYDLAALHCNFCLRGEESDADEAFCRELAAREGFTIFVKRIDTMGEKRPGESVEMTCRRTRYAWFEEMARQLQLQAIATAHHRDDNAETVLLNLFRGTGIKGLRGIPPRRGIFIRPLLNVPKQEILGYLEKNGQPFRTDSTNLTDRYRRNAIRNEILPLIERYFPSARKGICATARAAAQIEEENTCLLSRADTGEDRQIDLTAFYGSTDMLIGLIATKFGTDINHTVAATIKAHITDANPTYYTAKGGETLELYRGRLTLAQQPDDITATISIADSSTYPIAVETRIMTPGEFKSAPKNSNGTLWVDLDKLQREVDAVTMRHPRRGDRIRPFGMRGTRLVSDILKETGLSPSERSQVWLMEAGGEILWIAGIRASARFAVSRATARVLRVGILQ